MRSAKDQMRSQSFTNLLWFLHRLHFITPGPGKGLLFTQSEARILDDRLIYIFNLREKENEANGQKSAT